MYLGDLTNGKRYSVYHLFYNITLRHWDNRRLFRVHATLLASMCHAIPFRALKKNIFFDVDIVV